MVSNEEALAAKVRIAYRKIGTEAQETMLKGLTDLDLDDEERYEAHYQGLRRAQEILKEIFPEEIGKEV